MRRTDKTLFEQMQISAFEITNRKMLLELDEDSLHFLSDYYDLVEAHIDGIVDEFYMRQTEIDEISLLIGDADTLARLRAAQRKYVLDLFSGDYGINYVNNRLRIGMVHKRIGVEPKLYLSAVVTLKTLIYRVLRNNIADSDSLEKLLSVLDKLFYFDITLVFDTYIDSLVSEIENAKKRTELYARSLEEKVAERTIELERQAQLDPLTGLYNQRAMYDFLKRDLAITTRQNKSLSLIYFDIDNFKKINDQRGHINGDVVLKNISAAVQSSIRKTDVPCRFGGDEFCIILPDCDKANAKMLCEKIAARFSQLHDDIYISFGISESNADETLSSKSLLKQADKQMYESKKTEGFAIN